MLAPVKGGEWYTKLSSQNNIVVKYYIWHMKPRWQVTWESIRYIVKYLLACTKKSHACQLVGKPNQNYHTALLGPIPAFAEPFSQVIVD